MGVFFFVLVLGLVFVFLFLWERFFRPVWRGDGGREDTVPTFETAHATLYGKPAQDNVYGEWKVLLSAAAQTHADIG